MRISHFVRSLASGATVYVVVAACGASGTGGSNIVDAGQGPIDAIADAIVDSVVNPVGDARADPLPPDVATEPCNKQGSFSNTSPLYAVHAYPGKTAQDLTAVRALVHWAPSATRHTVEGITYEQSTTVPLIGPERVAVYCGVPGSASYDSVTFILPR